MFPLGRLDGIAAPIALANIDTDKILPGRFLKTITRHGLGRALFDGLRRDSQGSPIIDFILNRPPYDQATILVALDNFGCGSSREHAPWALLDFGIRCVVAVSFADIFYANCLKNGILPVTLKRDEIDMLILRIAVPAESHLSVDLNPQLVSAGPLLLHFDIPASHKRRLLEGSDDISITLKHADEIARFEDISNQGALRTPISVPPDLK